jgi:hypothetical protein
MDNVYMNKQKIKQLAAIFILLGVFFVGFGGIFGHQEYRVVPEGISLNLVWIADRFRRVGDFFMMIAPVVLLIADWRNIFPVSKNNK